MLLPQAMNKINKLNNTNLILTVLTGPEGGWTVLSERKILGNGPVDYVTIEPGCMHLYIASNASFKFVYDSENPAVEPIREPSNQGIYA